ncbi:MAG: hypothetical protein SPF70_12700 [Lachnospiraceae bacterium]|nr:hypothetical protein [Lachnospiraceae bacterium]
MADFNWSDNPKLNGIDKKKLALIKTLTEQAATKKQEEILPFFLAINAKANEMGITFNDEETEIILDALKPRMSSADIRKIDMIKNFTKMMSGKAKS